jgi:NAD(P)-dependent dehydrogenase (short-subunit alcohol dehydrogenase family)
MASLANKTALVTGASRGIGRATAEALAKVGAHLIVHYGRAAAEADALVAGIRAAGGSADAAQADLSVPEGAAALAKQVRAIVGQRLDIFVSNAGVSKAAAIEDHTLEDFDKLFATNVRSPFFLVKELLPLFREGSSIIVVSSLGARAVPGNPGQPGAPSGCRAMPITTDWCQTPAVACLIPPSVRVRSWSGVGTPSAVRIAATRQAGMVSNIVTIRWITAISSGGPGSQTTWWPTIRTRSPSASWRTGVPSSFASRRRNPYRRPMPC